MPTIQELQQALTDAQTGSPINSVESAIFIYSAASAMIDQYTEIQKQAKSLITDVITETGQATYRTKAGSAIISSPSQTVTYDAKALDALCQSMPDLANLLLPHRRVTERAGGLRITAAK